ncbi:hypothetical protein [Candidatus Tisiphia endosymbiont of Temnostethus pusillus]|uniref:hypothetical protein n=1 Tax=Candidatus Tisiphia endosymbiont of Temnostethus pusillus TaxID=3139335 RepID=UPI0035C8955E
MAKTKITEFQDIDNEQKDLILGVLQNASTAPDGLVTNGGINITFEMLREISLKDIAYALNHKEEFGGLLDEVEYINCQRCYGIDYNSDTFKDFVSSFADNSSFKPKLIKIFKTTNKTIALSVKTGINISDIHEKEQQKKVLIEKLCNQIKGKNVNSLTADELDQLVIKACNEAKSTDGFPMEHIRALGILSEFDDFREINEDYSYIKELLVNLYAKQEITSEYYHIQQERLHFYLDKVTGKNAKMWLKYATDSLKAIKNYHGDHIGIKNAGAGINAFISSIRDYYDQNDTWVAFISNKLQDLNNIDPKSIGMSVAMMTLPDACFTTNAGISKGVFYAGELPRNISPMLLSFIAAVTLQHYGNTLDSVNKHYMITVPVTTMREILIKALQEPNIFIGDNTTKCSEETLEVLSNNLEAMKIAGFDTTDRMRYEIEKAQLDFNIKQQAESLKKTDRIVPIKVIDGKEHNKPLNWVLLDKEGKVLHNLNPQDMAGKYAWFFKNPYIWHNCSNHDPVTTCDTKALEAIGGFDTSSFEHECRVETIGDSYTLSE